MVYACLLVLVACLGSVAHAQPQSMRSMHTAGGCLGGVLLTMATLTLGKEEGGCSALMLDL